MGLLGNRSVLALISLFFVYFYSCHISDYQRVEDKAATLILWNTRVIAQHWAIDSSLFFRKLITSFKHEPRNTWSYTNDRGHLKLWSRPYVRGATNAFVPTEFSQDKLDMHLLIHILSGRRVGRGCTEI